MVLLPRLRLALLLLESLTLILLWVASPGCRKNASRQIEDERANPTSESERAEQRSPSDLGPTKESDPCAEMSTNNRLLFCGPSAGEELWPYVGRTGTAVGAFLSVNGKCLSEVGAKGTTKFVPPLGAKCHLGPLKQCILASEPDEPFEYSDPNDPGWDVLWQGEMSLRKKAWSHTRVRWEQQGDSCEYWVEGVADTDGDGVYSRLVIHSVVQPGEIPKLIERTQEPEDPGVRLEDILK